ncbi:hypothetical protein GE061_017279 [Apolygus lucorum]|uniref:Ankyrin repeat domain-containing protein 29 n=2 Tax=Apolygus lucorum TaxID=248454 RepID=A0A8S9XC00_APOLU|nr:hypothetical protein GE061_017279 [Apolygus lucorum]
MELMEVNVDQLESAKRDASTIFEQFLPPENPFDSCWKIGRHFLRYREKLFSSLNGGSSQETPEIISQQFIPRPHKLIKKFLTWKNIVAEASKFRDGTTPLILSAANGHVECVLELLDQGADPCARRHTGTTALFFAAQSGYTEIASILLRHGTPVDIPSVDGGTPLFVACQYAHLDMIQLLIKHGSRVNGQMKDGATPLFIAAQNGHCSVVSLLLTHGARVSTPRLDSATPLWIAAQMNHSDVCKMLLLAGHPVDALRKNGATPLFKAAHKGYIDVVHELLKYKPNLDLLPNGESALHAACLFGHLPVVKMLMRAGAEPKLVNADGFSPIQLAKKANHGQVVHYLNQWQTYVR